MCGYSTEDEHSAGQRCLGLFETALDESAVRGVFDSLTGFSHQLESVRRAGETPAPQQGTAGETVLDEPADELAVIRAGWAEEAGEGCVTLDPAAVLRANRRSFALRVRGQSMIGAGICDGDIVVGEFTPEAKPGAIVVALIDGESTLKRFIMQHGKAYLAAENPNYPDLVPLSELVIQGVVHTVVRRMR